MDRLEIKAPDLSKLCITSSDRSGYTPGNPTVHTILGAKRLVMKSIRDHKGSSVNWAITYNVQGLKVQDMELIAEWGNKICQDEFERIRNA